MDNNHDYILVILKITGYWDGDYILTKSAWGWEYQGEFCFFIRAYVGDPTIIELHDCNKTVAIFSCLKENEISTAYNISSDYLTKVKNATAEIQFIDNIKE